MGAETLQSLPGRESRQPEPVLRRELQEPGQLARRSAVHERGKVSETSGQRVHRAGGES